ncbi:MAG: hypothetical protein GY913_33530 [Proteobacteria bacterium]|nr:hypothetical protein [Pseudomonadota bacterium]MCP4921849.1 hypothetical protein [Pseudomonadota bacterium]
MAKTPVHVVTGFLGAGKTTFLLDQLSRRDGERCGIVVNDFGDARIDATLLGGRVPVMEIPGGCVCCTAPQDLVSALSELVGQVDRVFIEATGLARPADIVDTLTRSKLDVSVGPVLCVLDARRLVGEAPVLLLEQLDASDLVVANHASDCDDDAWAALDEALEGHFPPLLGLERTDRGRVDPEFVERVRRGLAFRALRKAPSTEGYASASRIWASDRVFGKRELEAVLAASDAERIKGLFRTELGWFLLQRAGGDVHCTPSQLRSSSAVDVIVQGDTAQADAVVQALDAAEPPAAIDDGVLRLVDGDHVPLELTRWALAALPEQIDDVRVLSPKREGAAVRLDEVFRLVTDDGHRTFVAVASDGMTSEPVRLDAVGDAVLVHSHEGGEFPKRLGGPYRLLVPDGTSACANVKGIVRLEVLA